jgi:hypothetical protein
VAKPIESQGLVSALTDFTFERFVTARLVPVLYGLGLILGAVVAASYMLTALRLGVLVTLMSLVIVPLGFLLFALYLRVGLEIVIVLFRIEQNTARMAPPPMPGL